MIEALTHSISHLVHELRQDREQRKKEFEWIRASLGLATKHDLREMEKRIMKTVSELTAEIQDLTVKLTKVNETLDEISTETSTSLTEIQKLRDQVKVLQDLIDAGGTVTTELEVAAAAASTQADIAVAKAQAAADLVPNVPPPLP